MNDWGGQKRWIRSAMLSTAASSSRSAQPSSPADVNFDEQIKPILVSKCMPCHFSGGAQYAKMPFDRPETIKRLGEKLFTRIHDENHRRLIRDFLSQ
ncbi:MAG TPA: hypothetical protein VMS31_19060 [Pyrinomonadaceae bacterium]|nr:hypothetical protein [Pyrinomonadaceae bacterium]